MWPFKRTLGMPKQWTRCGTPLIQRNRDNPNFYIRCIYHQADGSTIIKDYYPYDGSKKTRVVAKGDGKT